MAHDLWNEASEQEEGAAEADATLSARVNERHGHGDSMFIEPTPREIHDLMELAADSELPPGAAETA
jgi:hypothetical protein